MALTSHDKARGSLDSTRRTTSRSRTRLTINYGLRFDILTPLTEANDYYSMVDTTKPNPAAGNLPGVYVFAGQDGVGSRIAPADKNSNNLGPRLGFAYTLNDENRSSRRLRHQLFPDWCLRRRQQRQSERRLLADLHDSFTGRPQRRLHVHDRVFPRETS